MQWALDGRYDALYRWPDMTCPRPEVPESRGYILHCVGAQICTNFLPYHTVFLQSLFSGASGLGQMAVGKLGTSGKQGQERRETRSHCVAASKSEKNFKIKKTSKTEEKHE